MATLSPTIHTRPDIALATARWERLRATLPRTMTATKPWLPGKTERRAVRTDGGRVKERGEKGRGQRDEAEDGQERRDSARGQGQDAGRVPEAVNRISEARQNRRLRVTGRSGIGRKKMMNTRDWARRGGSEGRRHARRQRPRARRGEGDGTSRGVGRKSEGYILETDGGNGRSGRGRGEGGVGRGRGRRREEHR